VKLVLQCSLLVPLVLCAAGAGRAAGQATPTPCGTPATFELAADADDTVGAGSGATYPPNFVGNDPASIAGPNSTLIFGTYVLNDYFARWTTSALPDSITVCRVRLKFDVLTTSDFDFGFVSVDWGYTARPVGMAEYAVSQAGTARAVWNYPGAFQQNGYELELDNGNGVNPTGLTGVRLVLETNGAPTAENDVPITQHETANHVGMQLYIEYVPVGSPLPTATATATGASTATRTSTPTRTSSQTPTATPTPTQVPGAICPATPATGCHPPKQDSLLVLKNKSDDVKDMLIWKWRNSGGPVTLNDLGDPDGTTNYALCLYAGSASATVAIPAGSKWRAQGTNGYIFKDTSGSPDGAQRARLGTVNSGNQAKAFVRGRGTNLPDTLAPPLALPVIVQMVNDTNNVCLSVFYDAVVKNDAKEFKARSTATVPLP